MRPDRPVVRHRGVHALRPLDRLEPHAVHRHKVFAEHAHELHQLPARKPVQNVFLHIAHPTGFLFRISFSIVAQIRPFSNPAETARKKGAAKRRALSENQYVRRGLIPAAC